MSDTEITRLNFSFDEILLAAPISVCFLQTISLGHSLVTGQSSVL